jgi:hypothetical protein
MAAKTRSNRDSESTDDFLFEQKLTTSCPKCGARMSGHAIVCLDCGHNKQSGKSQEAWPGGLPSAVLPSVLELVDPAEAVEQPIAQSTQDRGKKWIISAVLFAGPLCVGSFYSKAIGVTAGVLGFAVIAAGMIGFVVSAFTELTHNFNARRNLFYHAIFGVLALPFGLFIMRCGAPSAKSRPAYHFGRACLLIGLLLMMSGAYGLAAQAPKAPPRAIPWAPNQQPAKRAKERHVPATPLAQPQPLPPG